MDLPSIAPVLKTTITKSDISTSSKLRYCVKRELNIQTSHHGKSRQELHELFTKRCEHELDYQELATDLFLGCFCRTGIVNSSVILETDAECDTARVHLQNMTFTPEDAVEVALYSRKLVVKSCGIKAKGSLQKFIEAKFYVEEYRAIIKACVFMHPLQTVRHMITPYVKQFNEPSFEQSIKDLSILFGETDEFCVTHANFTADNVVNRTRCVSKVTAFGSELSHYGNGVYDWATFIADMLLWHYIHELETNNNDIHKSYCHTIQQCIYQFISTILEDLDLECDSYLDEDDGDSRLIQTLAGFTGVIMLFRTVGDDWNDRLPIRGSAAIRDDILGCAYRLISGYKNISSVNSLLIVGLMLT